MTYSEASGYYESISSSTMLSPPRQNAPVHPGASPSCNYSSARLPLKGPHSPAKGFATTDYFRKGPEVE